MAKKSTTPKQVTNLTHDATRLNIPAAEAQPLVDDATKRPIRVEIERRNPDLDPQLVWRGKSDGPLVVNAPPLYVQEKIHPKHLIDDLVAETKARQKGEERDQLDLFGDFNGVPEGDAKTEFYQHEAHWTNRMILGDSLQVMTSLAERENLRGKVQCIYFDPPYGIQFNSNFQWSTTNRKTEDGKFNSDYREPEQIRAFRDTWADGLQSYLSFVKSRLVCAKELLTNTGSIFIQIGDENVHRVRLLCDEIFGPDNASDLIVVKKKGSQKGVFLESVNDYVIWYFKDKSIARPKKIFESPREESEISSNFSNLRKLGTEDTTISKISARAEFSGFAKEKPLILQNKYQYKLFKSENSTSGGFRKNQSLLFNYRGINFDPGIEKGNCWKHTANHSDTEYSGMERMAIADRLYIGDKQIGFVRYFSDFGMQQVTNWWDGFGGASKPIYVVQTNERIAERCILMASDPGDLVLDPTCGSGTTSYISEKHGRRWITIDTSRVALALARTRIMGAKYPYFLLADSKKGKEKEAKIQRKPVNKITTYDNVKLGFVYDRLPHITSALIANNSEIDVIYENFQKKLEPLRERINELVGRKGARKSPSEAGDNGPWEEWEIPRDIEEVAKAAKTDLSDPQLRESVEMTLAEWWKLRIARQEEIDASIAAKADVEYLYDKPYEDKTKVRVAGPFTVESISPHRMLGVDENDEVFDQLREEDAVTFGESHDFGQLILENLRVSGVQQSAKEDRITFDSLVAFPGRYINAEGKYTEDDGTEVRAGIHIGPEYGSITRPDLVEAAREAADNSFDVLIACGFNYEAHTTEFSKLGKIPVLKARMNADLHMAQDLKATGAGNLFVIFGEPDIKLEETEDGKFTVEVLGVDIFDPKTGKVRSDNVDGIACWFVDTNYSGESFFVRHAYFLGAESSYNSLKRSLKAEVDEEAWESLHSAVSRPFDKPSTGRIAVKIINHLGDEVMKVVGVK